MTEKVFEVSVEASFSASHQLRGYKGDLEPLHGHNFRVEAVLTSRQLDKLGLVIDFVELEVELEQVLAPYDHRHLNDLPPFQRLNPTTENMAKHFYEQLSERLRDKGVHVKRIRVWEAPTYSATYGTGS